MSKADKKTLNEIHNLTAKLCLDILQNGEVVRLKTEEGEEPVYVRKTPSSAMMAVVTKFLKDNCIVDDGGVGTNAGADLAKAARELPEFDSDQDGKVSFN